MNERARRPVLPLIAGAAALLILAGLAVSRLGTPDEAARRAELAVSTSVPPTVEAGAMVAVEVTVTNTGSGEVESLFVSFALVGAAGEGLVDPLIGADTATSIVSVAPSPSATGGGVRFGFGPLAPGEQKTVTFDVRAPDNAGTAANSVQVYDGVNPEIAAGARLSTEVQ